MVAPVTDLGSSSFVRHEFGPFGTTYAKYYWYKHRYRQTKPFTLVLPYQSTYQEVLKWQHFVDSLSVPYDADDALPPDLNFTPVLNRSYEKLRGKCYEKVGAGVDFAEYKQSNQLIASTATTLLKAFRAVKSLRFGDAAKALRMKFLPKGVSPLKSAGNNWLEFHFGWEPLIKDIYDALEVIIDPVKSFSYERSRANDVIDLRGTRDFTSVREDWRAIGRLSATQGCRVKFEKPGAFHTLDQWGIIHPSVLAWELFPFSFVVDWFVNVGDLLSSQSDFAGMTLESTFCSTFWDYTLDSSRSINPGYGSGINLSTVRSVGSNRTDLLSGTVLEVKKLKPPSLTRAATAISLLVAFMK